ncbi:IS5 family transposase [Endozoicomonas sp. OPT23]|uniref:IS5 family transposase n=1 Tax=Endozoicomonas sp. OPT23 TaxID=2072845 RepID=UPI001890C7D0|nr:IS5 family transposase [Endozoicomonas sp. OPT23]
MSRIKLQDHQWNRIKDLLPGKRSDCGVTAQCNRAFLEAVLWIARTGAPWRDLPKEFGKWHSVYVRYDRWCQKGIWVAVFEELSKDQDFEYIMVDGSIVWVHQHGAPKKQLRTTKLLENQEVT